MSNFKVIIPQGTTNLCENPSFETGVAGGWSTGGVNTTSQESTYQAFGTYAMEVTYQNDLNLGIYTVTLPTATATYALSAWIYVPANFDIADGQTIYFTQANFAGATVTPVRVWTAGVDARDEWYQIMAILDIGADVAGDVIIAASGAPTAGRTMHIDGVQIELGDESTTYCDGDQKGCEWDGEAHDSTSTRSAASRAGGVIEDLEDDLHFDISSFSGGQIADQDVNIDRFSILPGGALNSIKIQERIMTMIGVVRGDTLEDFHANKQALVNAILPDSYPKDADGYQPVRLRYTGSAVDKYIDAHYHSRLEGNLDSREPCYWERAAIRWVCPDPFWRSILDSADVLFTNTTYVVRYITQREVGAGEWDAMGLTANPTGAITAIQVWAIAQHQNGDVYVGGDWTGWNGGGAGMPDFIVRYTPSTDTWTAVVAINSITHIVRALAVAPNGDVYVGGHFTIAGVSPGDYICYYDISGNVWAALAGGETGPVWALQFGHDGMLYIGGDFVGWPPGGANDYVAAYDGAAYQAVTSGMNNPVYTLSVMPNGNIVAGGQFTTAGGGAALRVAEYDVAAGAGNWSQLGPGLNGDVYASAVAEDGTLYVGGGFTADGDGQPLAHVALWNGASFEPLGDGVDNAVWSLRVGPDGMLYAGGTFTEAGGIVLADHVARWNGSSWAHMDVDLPGAPIVSAIEVSPPDPVIQTNYNIYLGFNTTGGGDTCGYLNVENEGTEIVFPTFSVTRWTGTSATLESLRNETTGKTLLFDYELLDGETLTIQMAPTAKSIVSSIFGQRPDAILPGSDFGEWCLIPGDNLITCFVAEAGGVTVEAYLQWKHAYNGVD